MSRRMHGVVKATTTPQEGFIPKSRFIQKKVSFRDSYISLIEE
jgi:hypothetical protein